MQSPRNLRLSLISLLLLVVPASFGALWIRSVAVEQRPIKWQKFTSDAVSMHLRDGRDVLVFASPSYHPESGLAVLALGDPRIRRAFNSGDFVALILEYDDWQGKEIRTLFHEFGPTKAPFVVLYRSEDSPTSIRPISADAVLQHLPETFRPPYGVLFGVSIALWGVIWVIGASRGTGGLHDSTPATPTPDCEDSAQNVKSSRRDL
ncbi:hypothetical protein NG895_04780 [Aeoliella sp. ICT_H6.2]|uniref:Uncharacterized protein n=1 Tax=Aeoliella straminimaris TaxID=2954799 RepID=A0A9X2JFD8_9BACT|nr:hypothetical protein [Aeoliella straminimaris]MCO6043212.1 hypothetical protein [Aeoliella straminimaris]